MIKHLSRLASVLLVVPLCFAMQGCRSEGQPWNVLVFTLDTTRADFLGCYGREDARTPNMDRLAEEGFLFLDAMSAAPVTLPSHSTIFTGTYPPFHGVRDNGIFHLPEQQLTLAEMLSEAGYATGAAVGSFPVTRQFGMAQGFDFFDDHITITRENLRGQSTRERNGLFFDERPAGRVNDAILPWLREHADGPFFAWIHYWDPHHPHIPPEPFSQLYHHDPYAGEIAYVDQSLGVVLDELQRAGALERTLIVVVADHGEGRGEHNEDTHSILAYNSTLRVPLIMKVPERAGGVRVERRVGTVDIVPTVLELLGMETPAAVQGRSLLPWMQRNGGPDSRELYYAEALSPRLSQGWGELRAIYEGPWKYIHGPRPELFQLDTDAREINDLVHTEAEQAERLKEGLQGLMARLAGQQAKDAVQEADAETLERLAALGYISTSGESPAEIQEQLRSDGDAPQDRVIDNSLASRTKSQLVAGDFLNAREGAEHLLRRDPDNAFYRVLLVSALVSMGNTEEAAAVAESAESLSARADTVYLEVARLLFSAGEEQRAMTLAQKLLGERRSAQGYYLLGEMHNALGDRAAYSESLDQSLELEPNHSRSLLARAILRAETGQLQESMEDFHALLELHPLNARYRHNYGVLLLRAGRNGEGLQQIERALALAPGYWKAYVTKITGHLQLDDRASAEEVLDLLEERCRDQEVLDQARQLVAPAA